MISSNTRARAHESMFKYEMASEEKLTHQRVAWSKLNCPKGQVRGNASPASRMRRDGSALAIPGCIASERLRLP